MPPAEYVPELWTLFGSSFLASTLLPGGSEAALAFSHWQGFGSPVTLLLIATAGNTLGGLTSWVIGGYLKTRFSGQGLEHPRQRLALERMRKYGSPLLLFSWLPVIGDPLCLAAGWAGTRLLPAVLFIALGKAARYAVLLYLLMEI